MTELKQELQKFCIEYKNKIPTSNIDEIYTIFSAFDDEAVINKYMEKLYNRLLELKNIYIIKNIEYNQNLVLNKEDHDLFNEIKEIMIESKSISSFMGKYNTLKNGGYIEKIELNKKEEPIINYEIKEIIELRKIQEKLISLKEKIGDLNTGETECNQLRKEINEISNRRDEIFKKIFKKNGINYAKRLDSAELRFAYHNEEFEKDERLKAKEDLVKLTEEIYLKITYLSTHGGL